MACARPAAARSRDGPSARRPRDRTDRRASPRRIEQVRVQVLNSELGAAFQRWYPKFGAGQNTRLAA
jgi:hypothetical protein